MRVKLLSSFKILKIHVIFIHDVFFFVKEEKKEKKTLYFSFLYLNNIRIGKISILCAYKKIRIICCRRLCKRYGIMYRFRNVNIPEIASVEVYKMRRKGERKGYNRI